MNITFVDEILDYTKFHPIGDRVLIALPREDVNEMINVNGILQPKSLAQKNNPMRESNVVAVGPECKQVRAGDTVMWNVNNATGIPRGEWDLYFLPENHLVCVTKRAEQPLETPRKLSPLMQAMVGAPDEGSS